MADPPDDTATTPAAMTDADSASGASAVQHGPLGDALRINAYFSPFPVGDQVSYLHGPPITVHPHKHLSSSAVVLWAKSLTSTSSTFCNGLIRPVPYRSAALQPEHKLDLRSMHCTKRGVTEELDLVMQVTVHEIRAVPRREGLDLTRRHLRDEGDRIQAVWGSDSPRPSAGADTLAGSRNN